MSTQLLEWLYKHGLYYHKLFLIFPYWPSKTFRSYGLNGGDFIIENKKVKFDSKEAFIEFIDNCQNSLRNPVIILDMKEILDTLPTPSKLGEPEEWLSLDTHPRDLEHIFDKYGRLNRLEVKRGYAFVEYQDERDASDAMKETDGLRVRGNRIVVEWAKNGGRKPAENQCFKCGREGHWAKDCRSSRRERRRSKSPRKRKTIVRFGEKFNLLNQLDHSQCSTNPFQPAWDRRMSLHFLLEFNCSAGRIIYYSKDYQSISPTNLRLLNNGGLKPCPYLKALGNLNGRNIEFRFKESPSAFFPAEISRSRSPKRSLTPARRDRDDRYYRRYSDDERDRRHSHDDRRYS
ncbi:5971_t:CDS:10 [Funneliformis caledonium]|uniref:5971_t:CDS:1 n=1 Tax=Funneliformis caledonium TaxID=1117310 RepID=A0A9N8WL45_9GLOM|nr:5971_t:CDS:10 [Funneliformis caledonium]